MAGRPIFKGVIRVAKQRVPVKLYTAVRRERVGFRLLHAKDKIPLRQEMYCSKEDKPVSREEIVRGFEVVRGQYVVVNPEEIKETRPATEREIKVSHFVEESEIDARLYDRPYYLGPDEGSEQPYALLARALDKAGRVGVCRWAMRGKAYFGVLRNADAVLQLVTLRYAHEVVPVETLDLKHPKISKKELQTAIHLIEQMSAAFDPANYSNEHQQRLIRFIEGKAKGEKPETKRAKRKKPSKPSELQQLLEKSLEQKKAA